MNTVRSFEVRWADVDANGHMRHSAYYDYAAHLRLVMFEEAGISFKKIISMGIGPALFREEARFYKEFNLMQIFTIDAAVKKMRKSGKIWIIQHQFFTAENQLAATITVEGTWIDLTTRRATSPPAELQAILPNLPHTDDFEWLPDKRD